MGNLCVSKSCVSKLCVYVGKLVYGYVGKLLCVSMWCVSMRVCVCAPSQ